MTWHSGRADNRIKTLIEVLRRWGRETIRVTYLEQEPATSPRLSEVLFPNSTRNFATLAGVPSNVEAVEAALTFVGGSSPFAALVGPTGWGKTHLMEAVASQVSREEGGSIPIHTAMEWATSPHGATSHKPLLLDNVQDALVRPKVRQSIRAALERRVRLGLPTMLSFTANRPTRPLKSLLPSCQDWVVANIKPPDPRERMVVISQISAAEGVAVSQALARLLAFKMKGNGRTLVGALKRLRLYGPVWLDSRATLKACGILDPFFVDNSAWDLKEQIQRISQQSEFKHGHASAPDMAIFTMLREACLSEAEIARFVGIGPSEVYQRSAKFEEQASLSEPVRADLNTFIEFIVDSLLRE